ncbi:MAG: hypoxanthine phosphoribosyltransferase [Bacteroidota bacterium]|jgi:hypoxanthine phosphoribosyltransferase
MQRVTVHDKSFEVYLDANIIRERVTELGARISQDYAGRRPLFLAILNGSFMFASDLFKQLQIEAEICFIKLASYKGTKSSGNVVTHIGLEEDLFGRDVIILEDIVDTGHTLHHFLPTIGHRQLGSLKIATLLHKWEATVHDLQLDYVGFRIPNKFVVGYGLDYNGLGRNLPAIYQLA